MLMGNDHEEGAEEEVETEEEEAKNSKEEMSISHHALTGSAGLQTIRLRGKVRNREITILVDSCSTYNFLDPNTAKLTRVEVEETETLWVTIGGGEKISSKAKCHSFTWVIQGISVSTEMRLLTLGDYAKQLSMSFMKKEKWVSL
ncbi:hypothetical protein ACOSQ2_021080 [Xanthoceras sorbifolium]